MPPNNQDHGLGAGLHERNWLDRVLGRAVNVQTIVSVVYVTAAPTFTGPIGGYTTLSDDVETGVIGLPVQQTTVPTNSQQTSTSTDPSTNTQQTKSTSMPTDHSSQTTFSSTTTLFSTATGASTLLSSTRVNPVASGATSPQAESPISTGLSGGAKAGLAIGILLLIGLLAGLALFWMHRERQKRRNVAEPDNEKSIPGNPTPASAPTSTPAPTSMSKPLPTPVPIVIEPVLQPSATPAVADTIPDGSSTTPSVPPQVDLRPVTQFGADFGFGGGTDVSNAMAAGAIGAAADTAAASSLGDNGDVNADKGDERLYTGSAHAPPQTPPKSADSSQNPFKDPVNPFDPRPDTPSPPTPPSKDATDIGQPRRESGVLPPDLEVAVVSAAAGVVTETISKQEVDRPANPSSSPKRPITPASTASLDSAENGSPVSVTGTTATATAVAIGAAGPAPGPGNVHRVQMDFHPALGDELELHAGQLVRLIRDYDDGWARCIRLDGSKEGVVPRTCLSARPVKPRGPPMMGPNGRPMSPVGGRMSPVPIMGPNGRPMSPAGGRMSPVPMGPPPMRPPMGPPRFYPDGRPVTPTHHGFPAPPRPQQGRPSSPGQRQFPDFPRPLSPGQGPRFPQQQRSMSPGPYGPPGMQRPPVIRAERKRSSSVGGTVASNGLGNGPRGPSPLAEAASPVRPAQGPIGRKPVP